MQVVSLFAGIGGFDLGFARAGMRTVACVEIDSYCRRLLVARFPDAVIRDDVRTAGKHNLPPCDVVCGGFPCQDLSVAGKRAGLAGARSGLFYEMVRITDELKPAFLVWENVPGLLSSDDGRDFARVLLALDRIGYSGAWRTIDAQYLGVAQRRRRVFGVFARGDIGAGRCAEILSLREGMRGHPPPRRQAGKGVAGCLESRTDGDGFPGTDGACAGHVVPAVAGTLGAHRGNPQLDQTHIPAVARTVSCNTSRGGIPSTDGLDGAIIPAVAGCLSQGAHPGSYNGQDAHNDMLVPVAQVQWASGGGKVHNPTAQALRSGAEHNYQFAQIGMGVRRITPTECCRLQGFPDRWLDGLNFSDSVKYRMLGNAVCVNVAEWIGRRMMA